MSQPGIPVSNIDLSIDTPGDGEVGDYIALLKPRVMSLVVFTALVGLVVAPGSMHPVLAVAALICIGCGAGASGALNMWYDADIDAQMQRTATRPIPRGRISPEQALTFGVVLSVGSVLSMGLLVNWISAILLSITIGFYLFVYTIWLKRRTPQNIVIGGAAGAFPPMIGWAAATSSISIECIVLFLIIFMWTPPHFWALALYRARDYEKVGVPMLPVIAGPQETRKQILLYSVALAFVTLIPSFIGLGGAIYFAVSIVLGGTFVVLALQLYSQKDDSSYPARRLFSFSILFLFMIFLVLLIEHGLGFKVEFMSVPAWWM